MSNVCPANGAPFIECNICEFVATVLHERSDEKEQSFTSLTSGV